MTEARQDRPAAPEIARPIFAVFEGGGAKGVAHVGALQAIEENRLEIVGVAGTSAGALIAVLTAIGLEAADIMSATEPQDDILTRMGSSPVDLLGACKWRAFERVRTRGRIALLTATILGAIGSALFTPRITGTLLDAIEDRGHFGAERIRALINRAIRERLSVIAAEAGLDRRIPDEVTFAHLAQGWPTVVPLKIVVTDVDQGRLEVFDAHRTPHVVVAEAVAASISIPLVFKSAAIPSFSPGRFADGGLVSNLPIWSFFEEKLSYEREHPGRPPVPVVGFTLDNPKPDGAKPGAPIGLIAFLGRLVSAALQGSQGTATRFLDDVTIVPLQTSLGTLDFDAGWESFAAAREAGRQCADRHLRFALQVKPDRIGTELRAVRATLLQAINERRAARNEQAVKQLRVSLVRPFGAYSLRVMESIGREADADDRLLLDRRGQGIAEVFRVRGLRRFGPDDLAGGFGDYMTKYERALVRRSVRAMLCAPIFMDGAAWDLAEEKRPEPAGVLAIDTDEDLAADFDDHEIWNMLVAQSVVLYAAVSAEVPDGEKRKESGRG